MRRDRARLPSPRPQAASVPGATPGRPPAEPAAPASPCVQLCALDPTGICRGCGRSLDEITRWASASATTRWAIWHAARERLALRQAPPRA
jgi:predicted Fe-S protein YdhL (DUF1289 family)